MAKITAKQRSDLIVADLTQKNKDWNRLASNMNRLTQELKEFAAWKNHFYVNNKGDFDAEDITIVNGQFQKVLLSLKANIAELNILADLPNTDLTIYKVNNDQYLLNNPNINLTQFDKRYQV